MNKLTRLVDQTLAFIVVLLFSALLACVVWQVVSRYLLTSPSTLTDELAKMFFMWLGLLGAAYTAGQKKHLAIDLLLQRMERPARRKLCIFIEFVSALFAILVLLAGGLSLLIKVIEVGQTTPALGVSIAWAYASIPISGLLILYYCAVNLINLIPHPSNN